MKKQILFSLITIGIAVTFLTAGTFAYFSDIETSEDNTFTAGTIDLSVDDQNPWNRENYEITVDAKPCETYYDEVTIKNVGNNGMDVWKHLKNVICEENGITEPEQNYYDTHGIPYLKGYWRFEETTLWVGTPDEVEDNSPFENHGTAINGAIQNPNGKIGQCAEFDGDDDYLTMDPTLYYFGTGDSFTVECWIKTDQETSNPHQILGTYEGPTYPTPNQFWSIFLENGKIKFGFRVNDNQAYNYVYSTSLVNDNDWHHVAGVKNASSGVMKLYIDGQEEASTTFTDGETYNNYDFHIGNGHWDRYYDGFVDEVAIWGGVLDSTEIEDHHDNPGEIQVSGKNDIDTVIVYDMWIENFYGPGGTPLVFDDGIDKMIVDESEEFHIDDIECQYIYLGTLDPDEIFTIVQSYHMEADTENWAQSDKITFDIEFFAQQTFGSAPSPVPELPGHGKT